MARKQMYFCTRHGEEVPRDLLLAKKVVFLEMGEGGRTQRSRVVAWLCPACVSADPDWNRPAFQAPGQSGEIELKEMVSG